MYSLMFALLFSNLFSNGVLNVWLQGKYSKQMLKDIGTFLRYMETQNNVKVSSIKPHQQDETFITVINYPLCITL